MPRGSPSSSQTTKATLGLRELIFDGEIKPGERELAPGEDPDIAGIVPGPQPLPYELFDEPAPPAEPENKDK